MTHAAEAVMQYLSAQCDKAQIGKLLRDRPVVALMVHVNGQLHVFALKVQARVPE